MGRLSDKEAVMTTDAPCLPRIYPEGVPVYDALGSVNSLMMANKIIGQFFPFAIIVMVPEPAATLVFYLLSLYAYNVFPVTFRSSFGRWPATW